MSKLLRRNSYLSNVQLAQVMHQHRRNMYQTLTVNVWTGKTYWQKPQQTIEGARRHASRYTRNPADMFIYDLNDGGNIILVKTILHNKQEEHE